MGLLDEFYAPDYSKLKRGQFRQDTPKMREYAANVPIDLLRGRLAGLLGLPSDVANMVRTPMPTEMMGGPVDYQEPTQVPYGTDFMLKNLPLAPAADNPLGRVAGQAGALVPLTPMEIARAARPAVRAATELGKFVAPKAGQLAENYMQRMGVMPSIVPVEGAGLLGDAAAVAKVPNINEAEVSGLLSPAMPVKPMAEVSPLGFYSAVEQQALNIPRKSGTGASFINDLMKGQDVKKYEIEAMGLDEFLQGKPNVTRQEVQDFIAGNRIDVQERQLGGALSPEMQTTRDALSDKYKRLVDNIADAKSQFEEGKISYAQVRNTVSNNQVQIQALDTQINEINKTISPTKYGSYQLPGGDNYREILLTLPNKPMEASKAAENYYTQFIKRGGEPEWAQLNPAKQQEITNAMPAQAKNASAEPEYRSSHFNEPNILAHMRVNDRIDADGKKMLLIEEVQSDWHQAGREQGYQGKDLTPNQIELKYIAPNVPEGQNPANYPGYYEAFDKNTGEFIGRHSGSLNQEQAMRDAVSSANQFKSGVPDAPFKDTWYQLALKRAIKEAVDKGYDRIGLTTGVQQAERFDLSKQIDKIDYKRSSNNTFELGVVGKNGETVDLPKRFYTAEELPSVLGKEVAEKIIKGEGQGGGGRMTLSGLDLKIGGEGMKKYYDEIYPKFLDKYGKKYGASVGETEIKTGQRVQLFGVGKLKTGNEKVRYLDITPEMRDAVKKGIPLAAAENITTGLLA
jgi:hypothetical protein